MRSRRGAECRPPGSPARGHVELVRIRGIERGAGPGARLSSARHRGPAAFANSGSSAADRDWYCRRANFSFHGRHTGAGLHDAPGNEGNLCLETDFGIGTLVQPSGREGLIL